MPTPTPSPRRQSKNPQSPRKKRPPPSPVRATVPLPPPSPTKPKKRPTSGPKKPIQHASSPKKPDKGKEKDKGKSPAREPRRDEHHRRTKRRDVDIEYREVRQSNPTSKPVTKDKKPIAVKRKGSNARRPRSRDEAGSGHMLSTAALDRLNRTEGSKEQHSNMRLRGGGDWDLDRRKGRDKKKNRRRDISGQALEKQMDEISEESYCNRRKRRRKYCIWGVILVALLLAIMIIAIIVAKKNNEAGNGTATSDTTNAPPPNNSNLQGLDPNSVAADKKGGWMDPWSWYNTNDFNVTYTPETVGGLPVIGLFDTWDDSNAPNDNVPNLKQPYPYGKTPFRGVNIGGWLSLEPFITPSLFRPYEKQGVVDEYTLTKLLGASQAKQTLEKHYDSFVTKNTFKEIAAAGLDHVRIPFPYWAIVTYPADPYVPQVAWRYLLRSIEWARQYGLRIKLDLHAVPGSQNGWNHSGRQGSINWINGPDGAANAQRSLDIHDQLSKFFSQPRYANIVTLYGLVNEPKMIAIPVSAVNSWTVSAASIVRKNGFKGAIVFGDGFLGLDKWKGQLSGVQNAAVDVHDYTIFNTDQIAFPHREKAKFACAGWGSQIQKSMDTSTGFGPTICGEWSQADTDCTPYLNNVGMGTRWQGTLNTGDPSSSTLTACCPAAKSGQGRTCDCSAANADPSAYSDEYRTFLRDWANAQITAFDRGWGWFYWTWDTESAPLWSWKKGLAAGILPKTPGQGREGYKCEGDPEDYGANGLPETY